MACIILGLIDDHPSQKTKKAGILGSGHAHFKLDAGACNARNALGIHFKVRLSSAPSVHRGMASDSIFRRYAIADAAI